MKYSIQWIPISSLLLSVLCFSEAMAGTCDQNKTRDACINDECVWTDSMYTSHPCQSNPLKSYEPSKKSPEVRSVCKDNKNRTDCVDFGGCVWNSYSSVCGVDVLKKYE